MDIENVFYHAISIYNLVPEIFYAGKAVDS